MPTILVIDDEAPIRNVVVELLESANFQVLGAENGITGVELAHEQQPDLIICDVGMPGIDGYEVLKQLQANTVTAGIPFIFLTAKSERAAFRQGMMLGADDYLTKPFTADELLSAIAGRLKKYSNITQVYQTILNQTEKQLNVSTHYDPLTTLPNRLSLRETFKTILNKIELNNERSNGYKAVSLPLIYLNLDRFNRLNETLGYEFGDYLLYTFAQRLKMSLSESEVLARLDADEFVILPTAAHEKDAIAQLAQKILEKLQEPFQLEEHEVFVTASIGISLCPQNGNDLETLLQQANKAMQASKQQGGNCYEFYTQDLNFSSFEQLTLETDLRYALERQELEIYYQPQLSIETGQVVGAEALLRWKHPKQGLISPAKFIPLAEETGLIEPIGEWLFNEACQQLKVWQKIGLDSLRVAINLSSRQFNQPTLSQRLVKILEQTGLNPSTLELELTESLLVSNPKLAAESMNALKKLGVQIAIDDFGTGYSSLSYLEQFPFDILKIDRCFIRNINNNPKNSVITATVIQMAHKLDLKVIAEGVETEEELAFLQENNCDEMQGYLFSPPVPASEFEKFLL